MLEKFDRPQIDHKEGVIENLTHKIVSNIFWSWDKQQNLKSLEAQGGITCGAIDEPRKSSKVIDERVIINFCDKNIAKGTTDPRVEFIF